MLARRFLILLLMWLVPLYPVLAGAVTHQPTATHEMAAKVMTMANPSHDCCDSASSTQHASLMNINQGCDAGHCIAHCAISLVDINAGTPAQIDYVYAPVHVEPFSSIVLSPPSRPPSFL